MAEILLINPRKKKRTTRKKTTRRKPVKRRVKRRASTTKRRTTRKKTTRRAAPTRKAAPRRKVTMAKKRTYKKRSKPRRNPSRRRRITRRAATRARSAFTGLNFRKALKNTVPMLAGAFAAKFMAKKFGTTAVDGQPDTWTAMSYLKAGGGSVAAAFLSQMIKPGSGQKVLEGGMFYTIYQIIHNELISKNEWAQGQFGAEEYYPSPYLQGDDEGYIPGEVYENSIGEPYLLGDNGEWEALPMGEVAPSLRPVTSLGNPVLQPVNQLGSSDDEYRKAMLDA